MADLKFPHPERDGAMRKNVHTITGLDLDKLQKEYGECYNVDSIYDVISARPYFAFLVDFEEYDIEGHLHTSLDNVSGAKDGFFILWFRSTYDSLGNTVGIEGHRTNDSITNTYVLEENKLITHSVDFNLGRDPLCMGGRSVKYFDSNGYLLKDVQEGCLIEYSYNQNKQLRSKNWHYSYNDVQRNSQYYYNKIGVLDSVVVKETEKGRPSYFERSIYDNNGIISCRWVCYRETQHALNSPVRLSDTVKIIYRYKSYSVSS
ncbi:hypothetical protein [Flavipsychrobacter stenotrophus]|nr:hypothetical protein [Flavipsychrobacter stenotrophus]